MSDDGDRETDTFVRRPDEGGREAPREQREFGVEGWLLVVGIVVALVAVPLAIYLNARGIVSLPFRFSFLVLPLLPAVLLALLAVWVTTTP